MLSILLAQTIAKHKYLQSTVTKGRFIERVLLLLTAAISKPRGVCRTMLAGAKKPPKAHIPVQVYKLRILTTQFSSSPSTATA